MNTTGSIKYFAAACVILVLAMAFSVTFTASAASPSKFTGHWQAVDVDGSDIYLTVSGPPNGPYQITWIEDYLSFCDGGPGNIRGTGIINSSNSNILEAGLHLKCFTIDKSITFEMKFRYIPLTNTLISQYESNGSILVWHRPGSQSVIPSTPTFVAYVPGAIEGYDWQLGDTVQININNGEYTAETIVEESPWDPNQTRVLFEVWRDNFHIGDGDFIVLTDGFITKEVSVTNLSVTGFDLGAGIVSGTYDPAYSDPWVWLYDLDGQVPATDPDNGTWVATFSELPPGAGGGATQWDMDGDGTSLDFQVPMPVFVAYVPGAIEGYDWPMGDEIRLTINGVEYPETAFSEQRPGFPEGSTRVLFEVWMHDISLQAGDQIIMTDEVAGIIKDVTVTDLAVTGFDMGTGTVSGIFDPTYELWVWLEGQEWQTPEKDSENGTWSITFGELNPGTWGGAAQNDLDGDGTSIDFQIPSELELLIQAAKQEGALNVIALPNEWCNFGSVINGFTNTYGIPVNSVSPYISSAEELQAIRDGIENPGPDIPDVIDVGPGFAMQAQDEGLITPYKVSNWETIPDFMKDGEGYWYGDYFGVMSIASNTTNYPAPTSWGDLLYGEDVGQTALGSDPTISNMAFFSVYAAALGNGGSLDDIGPGVNYFSNLNNAGRLLSIFGNGNTLASGETPNLLEWSYLGLAQRDANPDALIEVVVPQPNPIASYYAQAVSAYAPHPNAARLWMEYLYSDEAQLMWLDGYCFPARYEDLLAHDAIPDDLLARLPDITGAVFPSLGQIETAKAYVESNWACSVYGDCP